MAQVILKLYHPSETPWESKTRISLMEVSEHIIDLRWQYKASSGGLFGGKAKFLLSVDTPAYEQLITGLSGSYEIVWIPTLESDRTIDNYTNFKSNFLLSFGTYENINIDLDSLVCSMDLKGAAQHFEKDLVDSRKTLELQSINELAVDFLDKAITNNGLIRTYDVSVLGSSKREFYWDEPELTLGAVMKKLQDRAGGENLWGWGIRPQSALTSGFEELGEIYFQPYTGADELESGDRKPSWFLPSSQVVSSKLRRRDSDIKNIIIVRRDQSSSDESSYSFEGNARNEFSISKYGKREHIVYDSSVTSTQDANYLAAIICENKSNPEDEVEILAAVPLDGGNQAESVEGKFSGLVQTGLRNGTSTILVESGANPAAQGESLGCSFDSGGAGEDASCILISTSTQPYASRAAYPELRSSDNLASGEEITYVIQGKQTSGSRPAADIAVMELDRQLCFGWQYISGNNYKFEAQYFKNSTSAWTSGSVSTTLIPWSILNAEHTIYVTIKFSGTDGVSDVVVNIANDSTTAELIDVSLPSSVLKTGIDNDLILVNAWRGSGSGGVDDPEESRDFDLSGFSAYVSDTSGIYGNVNLANLITDTTNNTPPFPLSIVRVLDLKLGLLDPEDSSKCLVRYRPSAGSSNLIQDGSFEGLPLEHSNMFGGQTQSIVAMDQPTDGLNDYYYTYPMGFKFKNTEISDQRGELVSERMYCATYDLLDYESGKIELGIIDEDVVEFDTVPGNNIRKEFELDYSGTGLPGMGLSPCLGNLTKANNSNKWSLTNLQIRPIGGGTLLTGTTKETASWSNWDVVGDGSVHATGSVVCEDTPNAGDKVTIFDPIDYTVHSGPPITHIYRSETFEFGGTGSFVNVDIGASAVTATENLVVAINSLATPFNFTAKVGSSTDTTELLVHVPGTAGNNTGGTYRKFIETTGAPRISCSGLDGGTTQVGRLQIGWRDGSNGKTAARIMPSVTGGANTIFFYQSNIVDNWRRYRAQFMAKSDDGGVIGVLGADGQGSSDDLVTETVTLTESWSEYEIEFWGNGNTTAFTGYPDGTSGFFAIGSWDTDNGNKTLHIDQLTVQEIPSPGEPKSGYFATIQKADGNVSGFGQVDLSANYAQNLLGSGAQGKPIGGTIEIIPRLVEVTYQNKNSPLLVKIKGSSQGDQLTSSFDLLHEKLNSLDDAVRN